MKKLLFLSCFLCIHLLTFSQDTLTLKKRYEVKDKNMFAKGKMDAKQYYKGYSSAGTITLVTTLFLGAGGLAPAISYSSSIPKTSLGYPDSILFKNPDYKFGYLKRAQRKRSNKVWTNFGFAFSIYAIPTTLLFIAFNQR